MTRSQTVFCHDADGSATELPGAHLLACSEVLLQLSRGQEGRLMDELISIWQREVLDISTCPEELGIREHCSQVI